MIDLKPIDRDHYIVQKYIFDIEFPEQEQVYKLQDRFAAIFHGISMPVMEESFSRLLPADMLLRLDTLSIDIGSIRNDRLEKDFEQRFREALEKEISALLSSPYGTLDAHEVSAPTPSCIALIEYFLLSGSLPWWASGRLFADPVAVMNYLLEKDGESLKRLLMSVAQQEYVRRRIAYQFPLIQIHRIIQLLEPEQATFIIQYHADIIKVQEKDSRLQEEQTSFEKAVWIFILTYLLQDRGSHFNRKAFVKSTLAQMAHHFNMEYASVLDIFITALDKKLPVNSENTLVRIVQDLVRDEMQEPEWTAGNILLEKVPVARQAEIVYQELELIRYFLYSGSFPDDGPYMEAIQISGLVKDLARTVPGSFHEFMKEMVGKNVDLVRLVSTINDEALQEIVIAKEPAHSNMIFGYVQNLQLRQREKIIVQAGEKEFRNSVWQLILAFLYNDRGSLFNTRMFLESNIRSLAHKYRLEFDELLGHLLQAMSKDIQHHAHGSLFQLLNAIRPDPGKIALQEPSPDIQPEEEHQEQEASYVQCLIDVIFYWLWHGQYPWWAGQFTGREPASLLEELYTRSTGEFKKLLLHAGRRPFMQRALIHHIPSSLLLESLNQLSGTELPAQHYRLMVELLQKKQSFKSMNMTMVLPGLLQVIWSVLASQDYKYFDKRAFIESAVQWLTEWTVLYKYTVLASLWKDAELLGEPLGGEVRELLSLVGGRDEKPASLPIDGISASIETLVRSTIQGAADNERLTNEMVNILSFFLQENKLPGPFARMTSVITDTTLEQILQWLQLNRPAFLNNILKQKYWHAKAIIKLHDIMLSGSFAKKQVSPVTENTEEDLLRYMLTSTGGVLHLRTGSPKQILDDSLLHLDEQPIRDWFRSLFRSATMVRFFALHYEEAQVYALIQNIYPNSKTETILFLKESFQHWVIAYKNFHDRQRFSLLFREFLLFFPEAYNDLDSSKLLRSLMSFLVSRNFAPRQLQWLNKNEVSKEKVLSGIVRDLEEERKKAEEAQRNESRKILSEDGACWYVYNAGMVLLHPLLHTLFSRLQWMEKGKFISGDFQSRAVHLLQFLCYGTVNQQEPKWVLNKILCGLPVEETVSPDIRLTDEEKNLGNELLTVLLQQWGEKLKNTSIEGLRASFLQRSGAVMPVSEGWRLRVEQRGIDILLSYLPWGISLIKPSWMQQTLFVEWT